MGWILLQERRPDKQGWYQVIKIHKGLEGVGFFKPIPPWKSIEYVKWTQGMKLENEYHDRCVYLKYKCFMDQSGIEQSPNEILYWYELEPIPENEHLNKESR